MRKGRSPTNEGNEDGRDSKLYLDLELNSKRPIGGLLSGRHARVLLQFVHEALEAYRSLDDLRMRGSLR